MMIGQMRHTRIGDAMAPEESFKQALKFSQLFAPRNDQQA